MYIIGPIEPLASNGHRFILVAIDYFTKWVEASTYKAVTKKVVADFVRNNIVCRFGIPESIITYSAANLNNDLMKETCERFKITHQNSTIYRPQMNGAVEAANKNIKKILRKIVDSHRQWHEKLPYALLSYRTTIRTLTGATPYMLVYGSEAVIHAEVEIPSVRIIQEVGLDDAEWIRSRHEQLMLIDEKRMDAIFHGQLYHNIMTKAFNKKVKPRQFTPGQLVLKRISPHQEEAKGKFAPNWQGPYMVHIILCGGAIILAEMDGRDNALQQGTPSKQQVRAKITLLPQTPTLATSSPQSPQAPLPSPPIATPLALPSSPSEKRGLGHRKNAPSITHPLKSTFYLKRSILERFRRPLHDFFSVSSEICVSKNSKYEFLDPKLAIE
ncbi:uncharacterized protein LOC125811348 [Solanum verrucosum]|uniref:uncharacterized protein LOC125811348 n=1 Tax=Solanum verrucosum TaxID=315347 RepID=UPI0020D14FB3|nr:uncharacterized protein LOC125811348 [Solanum verrucosum]